MVLQAGPGEEPTWGLPGGTIESGETSAQAAVRETREETGLDIRPVREYTVYRGERELQGRRFAYQVSYWEAQVTGGRLEPADPDGCVQQAAWIPVEEIAGRPLSHKDQRWVLTTFLGKMTTGGM
jgi:ADP-ribose pyrophosphatase